MVCHICCIPHSMLTRRLPPPLPPSRRSACLQCWAWAPPVPPRPPTLPPRTPPPRPWRATTWRAPRSRWVGTAGGLAGMARLGAGLPVLNAGARGRCKAPLACAHARLPTHLPALLAPLACRASAPSARSSCWPSSRPTLPRWRWRPSERLTKQRRQQQQQPGLAHGAPAPSSCPVAAVQAACISPSSPPLPPPPLALSCCSTVLQHPDTVPPERKIFYPVHTAIRVRYSRVHP